MVLGGVSMPSGKGTNTFADDCCGPLRTKPPNEEPGKTDVVGVVELRECAVREGREELVIAHARAPISTR